MKTSYVGRLLLVILAAGVAMSARTDAASISTVYDMDRMLSEPHPMADEYGTRWTPPPTTPTPPPLAPLPLAPVPVPAPTPPSSESSPPPAPPPAAAPKPVVTPAPASAPVSVSPKFELSPRLSIDTGGLDVDVVKTAPPPLPPEMPVMPNSGK